MASSRFFWPCTLLLLAILLTVQIISMAGESQIYDEATHLAAGYSYLATGDYRMNPEHPPLSKMLAALPLLFLKPHLPVEDASWRNGDGLYFGAIFLYLNRTPAEKMLFAARSVTIAFTIAFGLILAVWTRRRFGASVALLAVFLYAFDPNIIAHGRYVTNDLLTTAIVFVASIAWGAFLTHRRFRDLLGAGIALALAAVIKFSGLILFPIFLALYLIKWWQQPRETSTRKLSLGHLARSMALVACITVAVIALCYAPETIRLTIGRQPAAPLSASIARTTWIGETLYHAGSLLHLPAYTYLLGLNIVANHDHDGHPAYLLGQISKKGWWYYFPVAFALKTPAAVLLLLLVSLAILVSRLGSGNLMRRLHELRFDWYVLVVPMTGYFLLGMKSHINIGLRHILPIYPFLFVLLAAITLTGPLRRFRIGLPVLLGAVILIQVAENVRIFPHYLAFFNFPSGGPARGTEYLLDSNIDWGQDLKKLRGWMDAHGNPPVCIEYFGIAYTKYYGIPPNSMPKTWELEKRSQLDCIGAISATILHDVYVQPGQFAWLREKHPIGNVGYSIYLYDLRKQRSP